MATEDTICTHCGATENFVPVQGIIFCGTCGRKVLPPKKASPKKQIPVSSKKPTPVEPATEPEVSEKDPSPPKKESSMPSRLQALKKRRADYEKKSNHSSIPESKKQTSPEFKKNSPSMPPIHEQSPPMGFSTPKGNLYSKPIHIKRQSNSAPSDIGRRLSGFVIDAGLAKNPDGEKVFTLPKAKLAKIEQAIRQQVKKEAQQQAEQDHSILEMEIEGSRKHVEEYEIENVELKQTLDEVMEAFQQALNDTKTNRHTQAQKIEYLKAERSQIRTKFEHKFADFASLSKEHSALKVEYEKAQKEHAGNSEKLAKADVGLKEWKEKYEKLKVQASDKIRKAAFHYTGLQNSNIQKEERVTKLRKDITECRAKASADEADLAEITQEVTEMRKQLDNVAQNLQDKVASYNRVQNAFQNSVSQYKLLDANTKEIKSVNDRYKNQIDKMDLEIQKLSDQNLIRSRDELGMKRLQQNLVKLQEENARLQSQLAECTATIETELKSKVERKEIDCSSLDGDNRAEFEQCEREFQRLQKELTTKGQEHSELMSFCEGLMSECEGLKKKLEKSRGK